MIQELKRPDLLNCHSFVSYMSDEAHLEIGENANKQNCRMCL